MVTHNESRHWTPTHGTLLLAVAMEPKEIGKRIAAARQRKGWTQLTFALAANVSPSTVGRWESGQLPPVRELMRIAELLEVEPEELVEADPTGEDQISALQAELAEVRRSQERMEKMLQDALGKPARRAARASG
jgi:transcriptional regulator with XRE-family HTH domain